MSGRLIIVNSRADAPPALQSLASHPIEKSVLRSVWFAAEGDAVLTPVPVDPELLDHMAETVGTAPDATRMLSADRLLDSAATRDDDIVAWAAAEAQAEPFAEVVACYANPGVAELAERVGAVLPGAAFAREHGADLFNRKSLFRRFAAGLGCTIPAGAVARSLDEFASAVQAILDAHGSALVKRDNGGGGMGNVLLSDTHVEPAAGASRVVRRDHIDLPELWAELTGVGESSVVVESYEPPERGSFYIEYLIGADGEPQHLADGAIDSRPAPGSAHLAWVGLRLGERAAGDAYSVARRQSDRLAGFAAATGYRGRLNVDHMVTAEGAVLLNETNARWGGGTVLDAVARRLLGPGYAETASVSSLRDLPALSYREARRRLAGSGLLYDPATAHGAVVLATSPRTSSTMELLTVAGTRAAAGELETELRRAFGAPQPG
ncbi:peptide ligase PGM1-related protein [Streptomyces sp. AC495_CC817]|uniref:preATP grasp domain-containing protein n=1 Tax=Streptomyces sp. AC495_CC817 TaxID=2823900 RepID=UPI001C25B0C9|nr:peptide ligase PGM1-related protein [Streptomyces sp. AC495_CC817]